MKYTVKQEVLVSDIPNFFELLSNDSGKLQNALLAGCILLDGIPIGEEGVSKLTIAEAITLTPLVMSAAGFGGSAEKK